MYYYIANPKAGNSRLDSLQSKLKVSLERAGIKGPLAKTLGSGDGFKIASDALTKDATTLVVIGGDQTVREVVAAVHQSSKKGVAIGIIPTGSTNTVANMLGVHNIKEAINILQKRKLAHVNPITINDHVVIEAATFSLPPGAKTAHAGFGYKIRIDKTYRLSGSTHLIRIVNQKFINHTSANQLKLEVIQTGASQGWLKRWQRTSPLATQLAFDELELKADPAIQAIADGQSQTAKAFKVNLSPKTIALIAASGRSD